MQCLIHQEALCAKVASLKTIMDIVLKTVNFILSRGLNRRQFRQLLLETESQYGDLLYFCNVCWLSRGDMLQRVYRLREEIVTYLEQKNINAAEFRDQKWVCNLAFLVNVTSHLNKLNLQLQGKQQFSSVQFSFISAPPHEQNNKMLKSLCVVKDGLEKGRSNKTS